MTREPSPSSRPGDRLLSLGDAVFDRPTTELVLRPAVADLRHEIAHASGRPAAVRAIVGCRAYVGFWQAFLACLLVRRAPTGRRSMVNVFVSGALALIVMTGVLTYLPIVGMLGVVDVRAVALLLPQALAVSIPASVLFAGLLASRRRAHTGPRLWLVRGVGAYSLLATVATLVVIVWAVPVSNQAFRERVFALHNPGRPLPPLVLEKGPSEMTTTELRAERRRAALLADQTRWATAIYYLHLKAALPAAALAFGLVALAGAPRRRPRNLATLRGFAAAALTLVAYYVLFYGFRGMATELVVPIWLGAWAPPLMLSGVSLVVIGFRLVFGGRAPAPGGASHLVRTTEGA